MSVMGALGIITGGAGNAALGAMQSVDFGRKGAAIGALVGVGGYAAGKAIQGEDASLGGAVMAGAVTGAVQSAFSTAQELYAFGNPNSAAALGSINTTTTANAMVDMIQSPLTKEGRAEWKEAMKSDGKINGTLGHFAQKGLSPENILTDFTRIGMQQNNMSAGIDAIMGSAGVSVDGDKAKFSLKTMAKTFWDTQVQAMDAAEGKSPWFSSSAQTINVEQRTLTGEAIDADGKVMGRGDAPHVKTVNLTGKESMNERMAMFVDANRHAYNDAIENMSGPNARFKDADAYGSYLRNIQPGALGTYQELKNSGAYDKNSSLLRKSSAYATEAFTGSPTWARTLDKQITKGTASLEHMDGKIKIKGGGKAGRVMAILADTIGMGGVVGGAVGAAGFAMSAPFKSNEDANKWAN